MDVVTNKHRGVIREPVVEPSQTIVFLEPSYSLALFADLYLDRMALAPLGRRPSGEAVATLARNAALGTNPINVCPRLCRVAS